MQAGFEQLRSEMVSRMAASGAFDISWDAFTHQYWPAGYWDWFSALARRPRHRLPQSTFDLYPAPQSTRWQEHRFTERTHDPVTDYWAVELARFSVPWGNIGFVKWIEQVVNDVDGNYYPTNVFYWGSPRFVIDDVDNLRWYLRLGAFDGTQPPRYEVFNTVPIPWHALPGIPYSDLHEIDAIWYPAHAKRDLKLAVPGGWQLRLFMISPPTTNYQWQVSGKLSGYTQGTTQDYAIGNARKI